MSQFDYNLYNDPRNWMSDNLRGSRSAFKDMFMGPKRRPRGRYAFKGNRRTKAYSKSTIKQRTVTAPMSRTIDTKYVDTLSQISGLKSTASQTVFIGGVAQGIGEGQRNGNDIRLLKLLVSWEINHGSSTTDQTYRLIIVRAKAAQDNSNPGLQNIIDLDYNGNYSPVSFRNLLQLEDFEILLDKLVRIDSNYATNHGSKLVQYEIKCSIPQRYSGNASTTIVRNPIHAFLTTTAPNSVTGATGQLCVRTIFSDVC